MYDCIYLKEITEYTNNINMPVYIYIDLKHDLIFLKTIFNCKNETSIIPYSQLKHDLHFL